MRAVTYILAVLFSFSLWVPSKADADQRELIERLTAGGHILMVRHALAPGTGDPPNFKVDDCSTQRNLNETGREQARNIGGWMRANGITTARVYSSQWCRCLETARLMDLGPVVELPALNSFFERIQDREPNLNALNGFISRQPTDGDLIVLVTHFVTIAAIAGQSVSSGEGILLELGDAQDFKVVGRVNF